MYVTLLSLTALVEAMPLVMVEAPYAVPLDRHGEEAEGCAPHRGEGARDRADHHVVVS